MVLQLVQEPVGQFVQEPGLVEHNVLQIPVVQLVKMLVAEAVIRAVTLLVSMTVE